ncbi:hypothetical protein EJG51_000965 [Undibacterium piscinae]|jgi:hypothetical protein|uniref:DUF6160 domain-containing protein n=1 Tax=Undibacterium piscinae TaxID=2495591 RepID=A0A3S0GLL3_9BURK|nr:hypothetical protein EJG51_000960 [Undibacterium piscinae]QJQ04656.1 hypothetical protein EJG51_000965 [Undibacterium piscinae]
MKLIKKLALAAALSSFAMAASAMTTIEDSDLSQVSGQDGVSIAANLNINVGSFVYTDTDATGGSVSFNNIALTGAIAATIDIINNATFQADASAASGPNSVLGVTGGVGLAAFMPAGDVVKIAIPQVTSNHALNMSVESIKMGNSAASYGSFAMNDIKLQGTTVYIWAH